MQRILKVAKREYIETAKTKTFIIGILMTPIIIGGIIFFTKAVSGGKAGPRPPIKVAVTDLSKTLVEDIKTSFDGYNKRNPNRQFLLQTLDVQQDANSTEEQGKAKLRKGEFDVYVVLEEDIIEGPGKIRFYTYKPKPANVDALWTIENFFRKAVENRRYEIEKIDQKLLARLRNVPLERLEIGAAGEKEKVQSQGQRIAGMMVPFFFMYLIFMGMVATGQHMLSSIIEEKNSRIIEVLLSAVSPFQLMAGKILGLAGIGLTVMALWCGAAFAAARWQGLNVGVGPELLVYFVIYYILGYILVSAILTGIGSVCNTIKETQSLMMPVMLIFIIPLMGWFKLVQSPNGILARVLSFVPPVTPMVMILRLSAGSGVWFVEIAVSILVLAASVLIVIWAAAKIFRTGILMYGKKPGIFEILRWLRQS
ncbi:MAG: ABC transporter permease [Phycisphaerae bacterium]|nr:ABC transporter permease [Phycisphaerae bacterium]NIP52381.1 ABC transporter permease [Phycisphaerae bacterium]NIS51377.1 ABC transporter permease [Phycisphaerae bacterium]NIU08992.1 ABC transporter permease [Phycisphaerae bacterium]NIU56652.1 ABC transporter permease [Phycisphaerae bacterium]